MNPRNGKFCRGPIGPKCGPWFDYNDDNVNVPADMEFLKEDVMIRYFFVEQLDFFFLAGLARNTQESLICYDTIQRSEPVSRVISSSTNFPITFLPGTDWYGWEGFCLCNRQVMPAGSTR